MEHLEDFEENQLKGVDWKRNSKLNFNGNCVN